MGSHHQKDKQGPTVLDGSDHTDQLGITDNSLSSSRTRGLPHCAQGNPDNLPPLPAVPDSQQNLASGLLRRLSATLHLFESSRSSTPDLKDIEAEAGLVYREGFGYSRVDPCPDSRGVTLETGHTHPRQNTEFPREIPDSQEGSIDSSYVEPPIAAESSPERSIEVTKSKTLNVSIF